MAVQASKIKTLNLRYEGSVKKVFQPDETSDLLWFDFTDDYSIFDWGKMPDKIANKGRALTAIGAYFFELLGDANVFARLPEDEALQQFDRQWLKELFESDVFKQLAKQGLKSHFLRLVDQGGNTVSLNPPLASRDDGKSKVTLSANEPVYMEVLKAAVNRPTPVHLLKQTVYYYRPTKEEEDEAKEGTRLIPLEVVFRFGMPAGSSLKKRLADNPGYLTSLGLYEMPVEDELFPHPVLEFFTKLEPKDRLLSLSEALHTSGLSALQMSKLAVMAHAVALALFAAFAERGLELWDGKLEFVLSKGEILLADSIGPDELRLLYKGHQLSKEMIRQFYRGSAWEKDLLKAQKMAARGPKQDFKAICRDELKSEPQALTKEFKATVDELYGMLANVITGVDIFDGMPSLSAYATKLSKAAKAAKGAKK
jgi:phosphoribosylaminoimidazole-succinocarboxamide synthase